MKSKIIFINILFLLIFNASYGQDFAPSQQAQGYLDSKNVTVDYATGLFHYQVPIYTLKSGDFELPITLNYTGKGVGVDDMPGLIDYNWSLNTGGIVTRTIRGGIADETHFVGYIHQHFSYSPTDSDIIKVNNRRIDGESDIFTVVFNGQSVNFIMKKVNEKIIAEPLERTNVRIECEHNYTESTNVIIDGWIITDENGNKYYFKQKEWSADIIQEDAISFNGVRGKSYISSWHISKIEPRNSSPIIYNYRTAADQYIYNMHDGINEYIYNSSYSSKYEYGQAMRERPLDFAKYKTDFESNIKKAQNYSSQAGISMQIEYISNLLNTFMNRMNTGLGLNPTFEYLKENINSFYRVMGQYSNLDYYLKPSADIISHLNYLIETSSKYGKGQMAVVYLKEAKRIMIRCMDEVDLIHTKQTSNYSMMRIVSPILDNVMANTNTVRFSYYSETSVRYKLKNIIVEDNFGNNLRVIKINKNNNQFSCLAFIDRKGIEFKRIKFDYYANQDPCIYDIWGFPKRKNDKITDHKFRPDVDEEFSKIGSLSKIINSESGEIMIDYGLNTIIDVNHKFGGIRIKSLILKDLVSKTQDTIRYIYPYPGELTFSSYDNTDIVNYSGFKDNVTHSRGKQKGSAFLNTGNNGVYYDYVEEEFVGKGVKAYLFYNPHRMNTSFADYRFWLNGLLLGIATYDNNGNLKSIIKNYYWADTGPFDYLDKIFESSNVYKRNAWVTQSKDTSIRYIKKLAQIKAYEYYMDYDQLSSFYRDQKNVFLYNQDSKNVYLNPYNDIFLPNIAPRTKAPTPRQNWSLLYGGKVLLRSQEEYRIEKDNYSNNPSINHFIVTDLGTPFNKVEYFYDNIDNSTMPTRICTTDSKGSTYTAVVRRVVDMDDKGQGMEVISAMKTQNILAPIVKQQSIINNKLYEEVVNIYGKTVWKDKDYYAVTEERKYIPNGDVVLTFPARDNNLLTYGEINYSKEKYLSYMHYEKDRYLPSSVADNKNVVTACYDDLYDVPIIKVNGYNQNYIYAHNSPIRDLRFAKSDWSWYKLHDWTYRGMYFYIFLQIGKFELSTQHRDYVNSQAFKTIKALVNGLCGEFDFNTYSDFKQYLDILKSNPSWISEFLNFDREIWMQYPLTGGLHAPKQNDILNALNAILNSKDFTQNDYWYLLKDGKSMKSIEINNITGSKLKYYILSCNSGTTITYHVTHSEGRSSGEVSVASKRYWNVQAADIDLSAYNDVISVIIEAPIMQHIAYLAYVPADCEFEATSYNSDGTVFCKFDHTGRMERYEYDGAGRVTKVFDNDGNLLKENSYNVSLP